jgi:hypothetical protein
MAKRIKDRIRAGSNRTYLAKDFESLRQDLIEHAKIFFPDRIKDFSEASVAGLLVDMAASVGDTMSFYLDHQFKEMDPSAAVEYDNIITHLRNAGVKIVGASPASTKVKITMTTPAEDYVIANGDILQRPKLSSLPVILEGTSFVSESGVVFNLLEDIDIGKRKPDGNFYATIEDFEIDTTTNKVKTFKVTVSADTISGIEQVESFNIENVHIPFREIVLGKTDVSTIISIYDADNNRYYEVQSLSQDTIFEAVENKRVDDFELVPMSLNLTPAPRRFVSSVSPTNFNTTVRFGSGNSFAIDDDIAPDPSELALSLYGKNTLSRFSIDPNSLIETQTLGISPRNTVIDVTYRHGGGLRHNVDAGTINTIEDLSLEFRRNPSPADALSVRQSLVVSNDKAATGGADAPDIEFLRSQIAPARNAQTRIVTKEDLLARIYTLPAKFGRIYRVGLSENPTSGLSLIVHILSLDKDGNLAFSPDTLKQNLSTYLNEFRLISDAIDIVDARILNYRIKYEVFLDKSVNKQITLLSINNSLANALQTKYFQVDQPLIYDDIINVISNTRGVISINDLQVIPVSGVANTSTDHFGEGTGGRIYSTATFNVENRVKNGIIRGDVGSIFELRYPANDIVGYSV